MSEIESRLAGTKRGDEALPEELRTSLIDRADREGLVDLAFERHDSPFGTLLVVAGPRGIMRIALAVEDERDVLADLARRSSPRVARAGRSTITTARSQLDSYFAGDLERFDLQLDWGLTGGFRREVLRQAAEIPYGNTASYAELAERAGRPRAVRAAGTAMATNPLPIVIPCHRVLRSDGKVGSYLGGTPMKEALLQLERDRPA